MKNTARVGNGAPSFCWVCWRQLQRAPGKRQGNFFFQLVRDRDGVEHRIHDQCVKAATDDGHTLLEVPKPAAATGQSAAQPENL